MIGFIHSVSCKLDLSQKIGFWEVAEKKQLSHVLLALYCCVNGILREVEEEEILHF